MKTPRYRFMRDEDCHDYIILVGEEENFQKWLDAVYNDREYGGPPFDELRCDSPRQYEWCYPQDVEKLEAALEEIARGPESNAMYTAKAALREAKNK